MHLNSNMGHHLVGRGVTAIAEVYLEAQIKYAQSSLAVKNTGWENCFLRHVDKYGTEVIRCCDVFRKSIFGVHRYETHLVLCNKFQPKFNPTALRFRGNSLLAMIVLYGLHLESAKQKQSQEPPMTLIEYIRATSGLDICAENIHVTSSGKSLPGQTLVL